MIENVLVPHFGRRKFLTCRFGEIGAAYSGCIFPVPDKPDRFCYYGNTCPILPENSNNVFVILCLLFCIFG